MISASVKDRRSAARAVGDLDILGPRGATASEASTSSAAAQFASRRRAVLGGAQTPSDPAERHDIARLTASPTPGAS